jgi:hypothetical protein
MALDFSIMPERIGCCFVNVSVADSKKVDH